MLGMGALLCDMRDVGAVDVCSGACGGNYFVVVVRLILSVKKARVQIKIYINILICACSHAFLEHKIHMK